MSRSRVRAALVASTFVLVTLVVPWWILAKLQHVERQQLASTRARRVQSKNVPHRSRKRPAVPLDGAGCDDIACAAKALAARHEQLRWLGFWDEGDYRPHECEPRRSCHAARRGRRVACLNDAAPPTRARLLGWANLGLVRRVEDAVDGAAVGMAHVLKVADVLFTCKGHATLEAFRRTSRAPGEALWDDGWGASQAASTRGVAHRPPLRLRQDWRRSWRNLADDVAPLVANGTLVGFQLGDELMCVARHT